MSETQLENAPCYPQVNKAFQSTCKILFGEEVGELKEFDAYLSEVMQPYKLAKSFLSGKDVITGDYPARSRFISSEEAALLKPPKLDVNSIKDIDSLLDAAREVFIYSGNRVFGTNSNYSLVDNLRECHYVLKSHCVVQLKYCSHAYSIREVSYGFGVVAIPMSQYAIKCSMGSNLRRAFESFGCANSSDVYYSFKCDESTDCMFSFGLKGKSCAIGNNLLPRDKYLELKKKLLSEIAGELKSKKRVPSFLELPQLFGLTAYAQKESTVPFSPCPPSVEQAFTKTTKLVLGEQLSPLSKYSSWLYGANPYGFRKVKGASGPVMKHSMGGFHGIHPSRLVDEKAFYEIAGKTRLAPEPLLGSMLKQLAEKIFFTCDFVVMPSSNLVDVPWAIRTNDMYVGNSNESKYAAFAVAVKASHVFGGLDRMIESDFTLNCYDCVGLTRCLEVDASYNTSDSLFCHNCENTSNALFAFNVKGKDSIIANNPVSKQDFAKAKKILLDYLLERLKSGKQLEELHLFSVPEWRP